MMKPQRPANKYSMIHCLPVVMMAGVIVGCGPSKMELKEENAELKAEREEVDSLLATYIATFNEIEENLVEIKLKEDKLSTKFSNIEFMESYPEEIISDIKAINRLLDENRTQISQLTSKYQAANAKVTNLEQLINILTGRLEKKEQDILALKNEFASLNEENRALLAQLDELTYSVHSLEETNSVKTDIITNQKLTIEEQARALNTAYIATGTLKELKEVEVVTKEGGILGIGSVERLTTNLNSAKFNKIDITETQEIPLNCRKARIVTNHPEGSYTLHMGANDEIQKLVIKDPKEFWGLSRYLVVVLN